jgi:nitroreductase
LTTKTRNEKPSIDFGLGGFLLSLFRLASGDVPERSFAWGRNLRMSGSKPVSNETLLQQLRWRYAVKKFDPSRKIPEEDWSTLEQALVLTPSSYGLQPWRFVVITDQATKDKLVPISWGQRQVADASHVVVFAALRQLAEADVDRLMKRTADVRGVSVESLAGFKKMLMGLLVPPPAGFDIQNWAALQAYIALGNFLTAAAMLGIDTCPMEGIQPEKYDELLGLPKDGYRTVVVGVAGYRAADDKYASLAKVRFPVSEVVRHWSA